MPMHLNRSSKRIGIDCRTPRPNPSTQCAWEMRDEQIYRPSLTVSINQHWTLNKTDIAGAGARCRRRYASATW